MKTQIDRTLSQNGVMDFLRELKDQQSATDMTGISSEDAFLIGVTFAIAGYEYVDVDGNVATSPVETEFDTIIDRLDNFDQFGVTLPNRIATVEENFGSMSDLVSVIQISQTDMDNNLAQVQADMANLLLGGSNHLILYQYIPSTVISVIMVPSNIKSGTGEYYLLRAYRNGLRLFQGTESGNHYDYWVSIGATNVIQINGNTGDRFIIEYAPE